MANIKWTYDMVVESAKKFGTRQEWRDNDSKAYSCAKRRGILDDKGIVSHFKKPYLNWSKEKIQESANKYYTKREWREGDPKAYDSARHNGKAEDFCSHMTPEKINWTKELIQEYANKYATKNQWRKSHKNSYQSVKNSGYSIEEFTSHMVCGIKHRRGYSKKDCIGDRLETIFANEFVYPIYGKENVIRDKKSINGFKGRPDFLIESKKLVIEFDETDVHSGAKGIGDCDRQKEMESLGYSVIRFTEVELVNYLSYIGKENLLYKNIEHESRF